MSYSAKKPYHNLKASIASFYKQRVAFMKQLLTKLSEFEKPYIDSSYPEMNLKFPEPNWPTWTKPWIPNPWHPEISLEPLPPFPAPGPIPNVWNPPPDTQSLHKTEGCILYDIPLIVQPDDYFIGWFSGAFDNSRHPPFEKPTRFEVTGPASIGSSGTYGFSLHINANAQDQEHVEYTGYGAWGSICRGACIVFGAVCPEEGVEIEYTTLVMTGGSSQTLQSSDGKNYWWTVIDIEGNTTQTYGKTKIIAAPVTNPGCETIEVSIAPGKTEESEICDSISINVTTADCEDFMGPAFNYLCYGKEGSWRWCVTSYDCEGILVTDSNSLCCSPGVGFPETCGNATGCEITEGCGEEYDCGQPCENLGIDDHWEDQRTEAMLEAGCCPGL